MRPEKIILLFFFSLLAVHYCRAQSPYLKEYHPASGFTERLDALGHLPSGMNSALKPMPRETIFQHISSVDSTQLSPIQQQQRRYYLSDTLRYYPDEHAFHGLYDNPSHMLAVKTSDFSLVVNPILYLRAGSDFSSGEFLFRNTRGVELYGSLDNRFYFYSSFYENQASYPKYIRDYVEQYRALRQQGNFKITDSPFGSEVQAYDFFNAQGYLGYRLTRHSLLELGHGRHFIGQGTRSLFLDTQGQNYFYFKLRFDVWKIQYQTIIAELASISARFNPGNTLLPKKYMATHFLNVLLSPNIELGLFEAVVFSRQDQFELQYLNPMILYRTVEHGLDSPDNVLLGLNFKWHLSRGLTFYAQGLLDEFKFSEFFNGEGWWGNKYGYQLGLRYNEAFGLDNLDLGIELNTVRPYTYSHRESLEGLPFLSTASYSHYSQPLAHPLGANFREWIFTASWQPASRWQVGLRLLNTDTGHSPFANYGQDILLVNSSRVSEYGVALPAGPQINIKKMDLIASYRLWYKLYIDAHLSLRRELTDPEIAEDVHYAGLGIRYNFYTTPIDY